MAFIKNFPLRKSIASEETMEANEIQKGYHKNLVRTIMLRKAY